MATHNGYNERDRKEELYLVEIFEGKYRGYKQSLLVDELDEMENDLFVFTECKGIMKNACQTGDDQISVCERCAVETV